MDSLQQSAIVVVYMLRNKKGNAPQINGLGFDYFRVSKSKTAVDVGPDTLRQWHQRGLPFHKVGKCNFVSRTELAQFIATSKS